MVSRSNARERKRECVCIILSFHFFSFHGRPLCLICDRSSYIIPSFTLFIFVYWESLLSSTSLRLFSPRVWLPIFFFSLFSPILTPLYQSKTFSVIHFLPIFFFLLSLSVSSALPPLLSSLFAAAFLKSQTASANEALGSGLGSGHAHAPYGACWYHFNYYYLSWAVRDEPQDGVLASPGN